MNHRRSVTADTLGAWVIKCNPSKTPLDPMLAAGETKPLWCLADNYRTRLVRPGHRVLFWVAAHPRRGFWGAGRVTDGVLYPDGTPHVGVRIPLFDEPVTAAEVAAVGGLAAIEVFRSPQQANPSWVSVTEMALLEPLLPTA
jgi:hypothetical protein